LVFSEDFIIQFAQSPIEEKFDFQDLLRSFLKDFHRMIKMNQHLKTIIRTSLSMNETLDLEQSIRNITSEACVILECHQADIYIVDDLNKEFWSKNIKGELERVPFDRGVLSCTMKIGNILKIDDWKNSQYRENDSQHFHNIKNLICSPITDSKGKIIG